MKLCWQYSVNTPPASHGPIASPSGRSGWARTWLSLFAILLLGGCATSALQPTPADMRAPVAVTLQPGDKVSISFPGASELDAVQQIQMDGRIHLPLGGGEIKAAGKTPTELEQAILKVLGPQLRTKAVNVVVANATYPIYVTGAVLKPGKIMVDKPTDVVSAIMEAGGFNYALANTKAVKVIRDEHGHAKTFRFNVQAVLDGKRNGLFYLRPSDIVYVPNRFFSD